MKLMVRQRFARGTRSNSALWFATQPGIPVFAQALKDPVVAALVRFESESYLWEQALLDNVHFRRLTVLVILRVLHPDLI